MIVIIKLEGDQEPRRLHHSRSGRSVGRPEEDVHMPDCLRGEAETCWDAANENVSESAEATRRHLELLWSPGVEGRAEMRRRFYKRADDHQ